VVAEVDGEHAVRAELLLVGLFAEGAHRRTVHLRQILMMTMVSSIFEIVIHRLEPYLLQIHRHRHLLVKELRQRHQPLKEHKLARPPMPLLCVVDVARGRLKV
jgi:hypothetical protein